MCSRRFQKLLFAAISLFVVIFVMNMSAVAQPVIHFGQSAGDKAALFEHVTGWLDAPVFRTSDGLTNFENGQFVVGDAGDQPVAVEFQGDLSSIPSIPAGAAIRLDGVLPVGVAQQLPGNELEQKFTGGTLQVWRDSSRTELLLEGTLGDSYLQGKAGANEGVHLRSWEMTVTGGTLKHEFACGVTEIDFEFEKFTPCVIVGKRCLLSGGYKVDTSSKLTNFSVYLRWGSITGSICHECYPGDEETRDCWTDGVGICELGWQGRWCTDEFIWSDWGTCEAEFSPGDRSEDCSDELDNDCDGYVDADDADCRPTNPYTGDTIEGGWYYGDANTDGCVSGIDLSLLAFNWGSTDAVWSDGDFNSDGRINFLDFVLLARNWGKCRSTRGLQSSSGREVVGEPTPGVVLITDILTSLSEFYLRSRNVRVVKREIEASLKAFASTSDENARKCKNVKRVLRRTLTRDAARSRKSIKKFGRTFSRFGNALLSLKD